MSEHVHDWRPDPEAPGGPYNRRVCSCGARARVRDGVIVPLKTQRTERPEVTARPSDDADWRGWREKHGGAE